MTASRALHWWSAALVWVGFGLGWLMVAVPLSKLRVKFALYQLHKTIGLTVWGLTIVRLALYFKRRRRLGVLRTALFALLSVVPVFGYLTAATSVTEIPTLFLGSIPIPHLVPPDAWWSAIVTIVHRVLAILLIVLVAWHGVTSTRRRPAC